MLKKLFFSKVNTKNYIGQKSCEEDITVQLIQESSFIKLESNRPVLYLDENDPRFDSVLEYIQEIKYGASSRKHNKGNKSILFGAISRSISKYGICNQGAVLSQSPNLDSLLRGSFANVFDNLMHEYLYPFHKVSKIKLSQKPIQPEYRMGNTNFTSGVINFNSPFDYHTDSFNLANTYSAMIVYKKNVSGGYLSFPEYGIGFKLKNRSIILFYGKGIVHGVTPIVKNTKDAYRISIVFYASENLNDCLTAEKEMEKAKNRM